MCSSEIRNVGSAQYKVIMWLKSHPIAWRTNREMADMLGYNKTFRFSGHDPCLSHTLYSLLKMGVVEKRDREIYRQGTLYWGQTRKTWVTEWRLADPSVQVKTTYIEWDTGQPDTWHVVQESNGVRHDMGKNW